jgi:ABC-type glutathione transport system ATPase component
MTLLRVENLCVSIGGESLVEDVSLKLGRGEILGVIGESGSGKSLTALSIMQLLPQGAEAKGRITLEGEDLTALSEPQLCRLRGRAMGMVFQEPMTALNPLHTIGQQVAETILIHETVSRHEARARAAEALTRVELPPDRVPLSRYPHELSGGQRQRVGIAMAIALRPRLLIADEPTTALDVTTQAEVLRLLKRLVAEDGMGLMLISHDLGVVAGLADSIAIMKDGAVVEAGHDPRDLSGDAPSLHASPVFGFRPCARARSKARTRHHAGLGGRECRPRLPAAAPQPVCQTAASSAPSTTSASRSRMARMSGWSANPVAASPPLPVRFSRSTDCRVATSGSTATSFPAPVTDPIPNSGRGCRWCFRTRTVPSTRVTGCEGS